MREAEAGGVGWALGYAAAAGVPATVLVVVPPVAAAAGPPAVLVWTLSALIGLGMAVAFAHLVGSSRGQGGGIAGASAAVYRDRSRPLAVLGGWGYWFGWSTDLAITATLVADYVHRALIPGSDVWVGWAVVCALLALATTANLRGLRLTGLVQAVLAIATVAMLLALVAIPLARGQLELGRLTPFEPPGGWLSSTGLLAIAGGLYLAGWTAYSAEIALTYQTEYRDGVRGAIRSMLTLGWTNIVVFSLIPLAFVAALGTRDASSDGFALVADLTGQGAAISTIPFLLVLVLAANTIAMSCAHVACGLAQQGEAWAPLARRNRHGVPANALWFTLLFSVVLVLTVVAVSGSATHELPLALLAAANTGYFVAIILALVAAWLVRDRRSAVRVRPGFLRLGLGFAALNALLLLAAGDVWGWANIAAGASILIALVGVSLVSGRSVPATSRSGGMA